MRVKLWAILSVYDAHDLDGEPFGRFVAGPFPVTSEPISLQLPKGRNLVGRVVTAEGVGVPHVCIGAYQPAPWFNFRGGWMLAECACSGRFADENGRFEIPCLPREPVWLAVMPPRERKLWEGEKVWPPVPDRLIGAEENDLTIVLEPGVEAEIRVVGPDGELVPEGLVDVLDGTPRGVSARLEDGVGRLPPLAADRTYPLQITGGGKYRSRTIEDWSPADTTVTLELKTAEELSAPASAESPEPKLPAGDAFLEIILDADDASAEIVPDDGGPPRAVEFRRSRCTVSHLFSARTYTLRVIGARSGRAALVRGLRPGSEACRPTLIRGATITGRIKLPPDTSEVTIRAENGTLGKGAELIDRDGKFEIIGLLPGIWHTEFSVRAGGRRYQAELDLSADGPPVVVAVEPVDD